MLEENQINTDTVIDQKTVKHLVQVLKDLAGYQEPDARNCEGYFWYNETFGYMDKFGWIHPANAQQMALNTLRAYNLIPQV